MSSTADLADFRQARFGAATLTRAHSGAIATSVIDTIDALEALAGEWQGLETESAHTHHLFQSHAWCVHWTRAALHHAGDRFGLRIITVRDAGRLVLVWPLALERSRLATVATWLGEPLTQYGDFIVADGALRTRWIEAAWDEATRLPGVDLLWLRRVRGDAVIKPLLIRYADRLADAVEALSMDFTTAQSWDALEQRFKARAMRNRRRHRRRLSEMGKLVYTAHAHNDRALAQAKRAVALKERWIDERGLALNPFKDDTYRDALWRMVRGDEPKVDCRVYAHELDGTPTAVDIAFNFKGRHYAHILAMNIDYEAFGAGNLLTEDVMRASFESGCVSYDLMAPAARYKEDFTDTRTSVSAYAFALTAKGRLIVGLYYGFLRPHLKRLADRLPAGLRRRLARG